MSTSETHDKDQKTKTTHLFRDLNADQDPEVTEIESLCLQCRQNGTTRLLLTKIPFYKEVVVMSFSCNHCHWENNELQPAAKIQEKGVSYKLNVLSPQDLARIVVKTEWASVMIPELDFEIPSHSQEGTVTTVEGIIERTYTGLSQKIQYLKDEDSESASKITEFLEKLQNLKSGNTHFTFVLRDCSGNSFLENICAPLPDPQLEVSQFERSREENLMLGLYALNADTKENKTESHTQAYEENNLKDEVLGLPTNCYSCNAPCVTNMKLTLNILPCKNPNLPCRRSREFILIPHFKDVVIMATTCDACGHKTNEVKSGSGIEPYGVRFILKIETEEDLSRDVLKSDTCAISIKELELEVGAAAFGSRYTTVEGILSTIKDELKLSNPLATGDSGDPLLKEKMESFLTKLDEIISGKWKVTLILDDPCGNSYVQSIHYPNPDTNLTVEKYKRSREQDEELGLLDMKVENYEES